MPIDTLLIEASGKLGGKIQTVRKDGFTIERGPDSFLARKESAARLVKELGLGDELVNNQAGQSFILVNNRLHKMPSGSMMGIQRKLRRFYFLGCSPQLGN